jgi:prepilin-type N-terminal cleavage/methylation domain-containing protein
MLRLQSSERGDTIVEVLIVLSILAMAFGIAFATSNHSLQEARNAQEHSAALQYMSGQIEHMRADVTDPALFAATTFCMNPTSGTLVSPWIAASCTTGAPVNYQLKVTQVSTELFRIDITWSGVGRLGNQQEQLFYKLHKE